MKDVDVYQIKNESSIQEYQHLLLTDSIITSMNVHISCCDQSACLVKEFVFPFLSTHCCTFSPTDMVIIFTFTKII